MIVFGLFFFASGTIGLLRFPDMMSRLHALTKADNLGLGFVIFGLILQHQSLFITIKLLLIWFLIIVSSASCSHILADAAHNNDCEEKG
jgi:multicomponent Na+:H+ antiporter subunit G